MTQEWLEDAARMRGTDVRHQVHLVRQAFKSGILALSSCVIMSFSISLRFFSRFSSNWST